MTNLFFSGGAGAAPEFDPNALPTQHADAIAWVKETVAWCQPERLHWCVGTDTELVELRRQAVQAGIILPLNPDTMPGCYYHRSNPSDVARVEQCTFICTATAEEAGPTNNWAAPDEMRAKLAALTKGAMKGRTLFVVPYLMGPPGARIAKVGIELTDSIYVVLSMAIMTRMGQVAWSELGRDGSFNRGLHCMLDLNPAKRFIAHFPQDNAIISTASNYGGNVLLGKKCLALRIASWLANREGWLAEHMLIMGVESPTGERTYIAAAFPSACGKTNLAMLIPPERFAGWKIWTVGDDIAWMYPGDDGRLYAINPENGYFGVAPGTSASCIPNALASVQRETIFTNLALTPEREVWWEGMTATAPAHLTDWQGQPWTPADGAAGKKAAHPNSRFAAPATNNPMFAPEANDPRGVPISAIVFGGRRASTFPLIFQAFNWAHGVYLGATMGSETTAAATGAVGQVRRDPMAMLPFCGYNMGDYFAHWLSVGKKLAHPPRIFHVNWFRKGADGKFLWPGFGENMRVVKWLVDRCHGRAVGEETVLGWMPDVNDIDLGGLDNYSTEDLSRAQAIVPDEWRHELTLQQELFDRLGARLPRELTLERELLAKRLD